MLVTYLLKRVELVKMYYANVKYCGFVCFGYKVTSRFGVGIYIYIYMYAFVYTYVTYSSYGLTTTNLKRHIMQRSQIKLLNIIIIKRRHKMYTHKHCAYFIVIGIIKLCNQYLWAYVHAIKVYRHVRTCVILNVIN